jgi:hypothetical protein
LISSFAKYLSYACSVIKNFSSKDSLIISNAYVDLIGSINGYDTLVKILGKNDDKNIEEPPLICV